MSGMKQWEAVDAGWGRLAADFATLSEPSNVREYVGLHHALGVAVGDRLLDLACGAGLALELASLRGAQVAGIDASPRLVAVARDRNPDGDVRVGDMNELPWDSASFDVVTSFRGIWATTPNAMAEALRVLKPGGRFGMTVWGHIKASPGAWSLSPFTLAAEPQVRNQADMNQMGRPGVGERLLADAGFADIERLDIPFVWEFADPEQFARALASTGPAYEAIEQVGAEEFHRRCVELAAGHVRDGLPLRAKINVAGFTARRPVEVPESYEGDFTGSFLGWYPPSEYAEQSRQADLDEDGFVWTVTKLWARMPGAFDDLFALQRSAAKFGGLSLRQRGVLTTAMAATLGDSACAYAWGGKYAKWADDPDVPASALRGDDDALPPDEKALAGWARKVVRDPNATTSADVDDLRRAGFTDDQIFAATLFLVLRLAFSSFNDALGLRLDQAVVDKLPAAVRDAVTWGRAPI
ncbi:methyltransferase family protein [Amycolatopsis echigonensis]|uniref:Methyltransferase family protein n=2 Tax=Amycolatopsis echigonensis TaxID=2576905 RepID=A0A2N3X282_9PSEU|nr:methyltransferase family protein [Amycolatopsis niigatensis]